MAGNKDHKAKNYSRILGRFLFLTHRLSKKIKRFLCVKQAKQSDGQKTTHGFSIDN